MFCNKDVLKNFANFTGKHMCCSLFFIKLQVFMPATSLKGDSNTGIFLWKREIFKNTFFEEYLRTTAFVVSFSWHLFWSLFLINLQVFRSVTLLKRDFSTGVFLWNLQEHLFWRISASYYCLCSFFLMTQCSLFTS